MGRLVLISALVMCVPLLALAQEAPPPLDPAAMQQELEQMEAEGRRMEEEHLAQLQQMDPELYQQEKGRMERQRKIEALVAQVHAGTLSATQAERKLSPLVQQDLQVELTTLPDRISQLEEHLTFLRRVQKDPDLLIRQRIDQLLGRTSELSPPPVF